MDEVLSQENIDALVETMTHDPRTFTQAVIDRMFPHPLRAYGSALWCVGRMNILYRERA